jgi:creatinine amidohydrolase
MKISEMNWMQLEEYLAADDRCVLPLGSTEQHAFASLSTDSILAERIATDAAEPLGIPVFPALPYGITPYFMGYPGTVTLSPTTYDRVVTEVLASLRRHGFMRIVVVNGHGGNSPARPAAEAWAAGREGVQLLWHDWWRAPDVRAAIDEIDPAASHASWMETFPWTRVEGAEPPDAHKPTVDLSDRDELSPARFRELIGDGSFGGYYTRPDADMLRIWEVAVRETRAVMSGGWSK